MAFDQTTRNRLQRFVSGARDGLTVEFTRQLQQQYGLDPKDGSVTPVENLRHLDDAGRATARLLRDTLEHYMAASPSGDRGEALDRIVREQAFTVLNRLAALRMAEARGILTESVSKGYDSKGFQLYLMLAGTGHGETGDAYRSYLFSIFDEFALDLNVLFDRFSPQGRLFPREATLLQLLGLMNDVEVAPLWGEDETVGWIYQYFNDPAERKKMRDLKQGGSAAPRNSHELAVRNQFFTPRYVVEFLTDNTLGRIWYEMTRGVTQIKDKCRYLVHRPNEVFLAPGEVVPVIKETAEQPLSQEELLDRPVYIAHRPLKDPRMIRMLDPACGSMHFGLYAYDLLEVIYEEAWEMEATLGADAFSLAPGLSPLREAYADKEAFLRDVPRLIIEHNLHGIDIDTRAVQIAGLSLWLRAQRTWAEQGVKRSYRPQVKRSNIVCAEPMPGEESLLKEFVDMNLSATPELRLLGQLVRHVFDAMKLAGEAGSLLKIETEIADAVAEAKLKWLEVPAPKQESLFAEMALPEQQQLGYEVAGIIDEAFWERAEKLIYDALQSYAEQSENGGGYQRRLFAEDTARGFAFIDLCRNRYDVVLMNPPFGWSTPLAKIYQDKNYPNSKNDIYCLFVERMLEVIQPKSFIGSITSRTAFFLSSMELWREQVVLSNSSVETFADLGFGVLDAAFVETSAFVLQKVHSENPASFIRLNEAVDKSSALLDSVSMGGDFVLRTSDLSLLPGSPFSYWISPKIRKLFVTLPNLDGIGVTPAVGCATSDNERFLRNRWEIPVSSRDWTAYPKGGGWSRFHQDINLMVDWKNNGAAIKAQVASRYGSASRFVQNTAYYGMPGLTYPRITVKGFSVRVMPAGCIFSDVGQGMFSVNGDYWTLLGLLNSEVVEFLMRSLTPSRMWNAGFIKKLPIPLLKEVEKELVKNLARQLHDLAFLPDLQVETSSRFTGLQVGASNTLNDWLQMQRGLKIHAHTEYEQLLSDLNEVMLSSYGLKVEDIRMSYVLEGGEQEEDEATELLTLESEDASSLSCPEMLSYLIGCAVGRWNIHHSVGNWNGTDLPDPFEPLPICPPGMLQNEEGLPAAPGDVPESYPLRISWPGILVDDPGHAEDIEGRAREILNVIWPERADAIEQEACEILGIRSLREYLRKPNLFFADHLKRYSKSRRQAPIYWPLSTPSGSYTLWLYYHRLDAQTLYACVVEFVEPKLRQTNDALGQLRAKPNRARDEERESERLQDFALELQSFRDELLRLAQLPWRPNLNDGVQITAAPLWQLFRLPKWQKTLKETWQKLEKGDYDWAHLAMTVWPERVVPKCVKDRSLAIAHGLEDLFWVEDDDVWRKLCRPEQEVEEQKKRQHTDARERVRVLLGKLAAGEEGNLGSDEVGRRLAEGGWDDREVTLLLYPHRVADACWENPNIARRLNIQLPARRSVAAREQFTKKLIKAGCSDIASRLESALRDRAENFRTLWEEMERGDHDDFEVAAALWPERVVDKCAEDVFMAERHSIQRFLWCDHPSGVWRKREDPDTEVANEVARRRGAGRREGVNG